MYFKILLKKQDFSMNFMYKYVELNSEIHLLYIIFCLKNIYTINII